jgi:hypothetical protein
MESPGGEKQVRNPEPEANNDQEPEVEAGEPVEAQAGARTRLFDVKAHTTVPSVPRD